MKREEIKIPISMIGEPEHVLERYRDLIMAGESPGIAAICASRVVPGANTSTTHYLGHDHRSLEAAGGKDYARRIRAQAIAAGIPINEHSIYNGTIADERAGGDPQAWIHNGESHDKFRQVCEERGKDCESLRTKVDRDRSMENFDKKDQAINKRNARRKEIAEERQHKRRKQLGI